jgi:hypothetical protein
MVAGNIQQLPAFGADLLCFHNLVQAERGQHVRGRLQEEVCDGFVLRVTRRGLGSSSGVAEACRLLPVTIDATDLQARPRAAVTSFQALCGGRQVAAAAVFRQAVGKRPAACLPLTLLQIQLLSAAESTPGAAAAAAFVVELQHVPVAAHPSAGC